MFLSEMWCKVSQKLKYSSRIEIPQNDTLVCCLTRCTLHLLLDVISSLVAMVISMAVPLCLKALQSDSS